MKAILITFDQAYYERIIDMLEKTIAADLLHGRMSKDEAAQPESRTTGHMHGRRLLRL